MTTAAIVVALVVAAVIVLLLVRGQGTQLQGPPAVGPQPPVEPTRRPAGRPPPVTPVAADGKPSARPGPPPAPQPLASADVLPDDARPSQKQAPAAVHAARDISGLRRGLAATRGGFMAKLTAVFQGKKELDPAILEQMEEVMLASDVGPKTTRALLARLRDDLADQKPRDAEAVWAALRAEATRILSVGQGSSRPPAKPSVVLVVGVNGVGKTTTIGKLATRHHAAGHKVVLAAGDTFRAAAVQQLEVWGKRVGVEVVRGKEGADPGAVAFDAVTRARELGADLLFVDTAGRLHTRAPLMDEIKKVRKTLGKGMEGAPHETLLVLDATTGQNALTQAALFKDALDLTGIVLTKLDGTAKGGIVLGICDELKLPVRYIGLGERAEDLREFSAEDFVEALFGKNVEEVAAA
ncbi:MAG: signal recognition particle-docking protein FtsY [Myxococcota bacterium]|nr:signal recognition particle-docking protein FtsY [Myxococcota bacterium]